MVDIREKEGEQDGAKPATNGHSVANGNKKTD